MENLLELFQNFWLLLQQGQLPEVGRWNYILLGLLVILEGPIATLLAAAAASAGLMRSWVVFFVASIANLTADTLWYSLGYYGKADAVLRWGPLAKIKEKHLDRLQVAMEKHTLKILFLAKLTAGFMIPSLIATGLARIPWKRWFPILILGETIWTGSLVMIGYYTTENLKVIATDLTRLVLVVSVLFIAFVIWDGRRILLKTAEFTDAFYGDKEDTHTDAHPHH